MLEGKHFEIIHAVDSASSSLYQTTRNFRVTIIQPVKDMICSRVCEIFYSVNGVKPVPDLSPKLM